MKMCTKCGEDRELTEFSKSSLKKDGLQPKCKVCVKEYYQANKASIAVRTAAYYQTNKAQKAAYYQANKEALAVRTAAYCQANKETIAVRTAAYYQTNKAQAAEYRQVNKVALAVKAAEYYQANKEVIAVQKAAYQQTPKGKAVSKNSAHKRRVVIKDGCVSTEELQQLLIEDNTECFYCGCVVTDYNRHIDHFIPISKGGLHDLQNLVVACATCNLKKSDKMPEEFMAEQGLIQRNNKR